MKVAVSGASGFVGRHVVAALVRAGVAPTLWVRPASARADDLGLAVVAADLHDAPADLFARLGRPDCLIHLAWGGLPNYRSLHHYEREAPAHYAVLKRLIDDGLKSLLVTGTCFEYGMQSGPLAESAGIRLPMEPWRGQMLLFDAPSRPLRRIVFCGELVLIPRPHGPLIVGTTLAQLVYFRKRRWI